MIIRSRYLMLVLPLLLMGAVNLQTTSPATPDLSTIAPTLVQYGLLAWLIIRAETRQTEQSKAWRDERRWLIGLLVAATVPGMKIEQQPPP